MTSSPVTILPGNDETIFAEVESMSRPGLKFQVMHDKDHHWLCTCEQYFFRKVYCKHMRMVADVTGITDTMVYAEVA